MSSRPPAVVLGKPQPFEQRVTYVRQWFDAIGLDTDVPLAALPTTTSTTTTTKAADAKPLLRGMAVRIEPFSVANCGQGQREVRVGPNLEYGRVVVAPAVSDPLLAPAAHKEPPSHCDDMPELGSLSVHGTSATHSTGEAADADSSSSSGTLAAAQIAHPPQHHPPRNALDTLPAVPQRVPATIVGAEPPGNALPIPRPQPQLRRKHVTRRKRATSLDGVAHRSESSWSQFYSPFSHQHRLARPTSGSGSSSASSSASASNNNNDNTDITARFASMSHYFPAERNGNKTSNRRSDRGACLRRARMRNASSEGDLTAMLLAITHDDASAQGTTILASESDVQQCDGRERTTQSPLQQPSQRLCGAKRSKGASAAAELPTSSDCNNVLPTETTRARRRSSHEGFQAQQRSAVECDQKRSKRSPPPSSSESVSVVVVVAGCASRPGAAVGHYRTTPTLLLSDVSPASNQQEATGEPLSQATACDGQVVSVAQELGTNTSVGAAGDCLLALESPKSRRRVLDRMPSR